MRMKRKFLNILLCLLLVLSLAPGAMAATLDTAGVAVDNTPDNKTIVTISGDDTVLKALDAEGKTAKIAVKTDFEEDTAVYVLLLDDGEGQLMEDAWVTKGEEKLVQFTVPMAGTYEIYAGNPPAISVEEPVLELSETSYTYDGTAKEPAVTVKNGTTVIPASEYTVSYSGNVNAGTATVTVTDREGGRYQLSESTATFTIAPHQLSWFVGELSAGKDEGQTGEASVTGTLGLSGIVSGETVSFTHGALVTSGFTATEPGTYNVAVVPAEGSWSFPENSNYLFPAGNPTITATVRKVQADPAEYAIKVDAGRHGRVTVSHSSAESGTTVTITVKPDSDYKLKSLRVEDAKGGEVKLTDLGKGKYSFTMPAKDVTIEASFKRNWRAWLDNPKTGDPIMAAAAVMLLSAASLTVMIPGAKKKRR